MSANEAVTKDTSAKAEGEQAQDQTGEIATLMGLKHPGILQSIFVNFVLTLEYNDKRFIDRKDTFSAVSLEEGSRNLYNPIKKAKDEKAVAGILRVAIPQIIKQLSTINSAKIMMLSDKPKDIKASFDKLVQNVVSAARMTMTRDNDEKAILSTDTESIKLSDYMAAGSWSSSSSEDATTHNTYFVGLTVQVPELYDAELKKRVVDRIYKWLQNIVLKTSPQTNILMALALNPSFLADEDVRGFVEELYEDNWLSYTRQDLYNDGGENSWVPEFKKNIESLLLRSDGKTFTSEILYVKPVDSEEEEEATEE